MPQLAILSLTLCLTLPSRAAETNVVLTAKQLVGSYTTLGLEIESGRGTGTVKLSAVPNGKFQLNGTAQIAPDDKSFNATVSFKNAVVDLAATNALVACDYKFTYTGSTKDGSFSCSSKAATVKVSQIGPPIILSVECHPLTNGFNTQNAVKSFSLVKSKK